MPNEQGRSGRQDRTDTAAHGVSRDDVDAGDGSETGDGVEIGDSVGPGDVEPDERIRSDDTDPGAVIWVRRWRLVYTIALLVLGASVVPVPAIGVAQSEPAGANILSPTLVFHLIGYAALAVSLARVQLVEQRHVLAAAVTIGVTVGFGFGIELLQTLVPWRRFAWIDSAANATGACVGVIVHAVIRARIHASR